MRSSTFPRRFFHSSRHLRSSRPYIANDHSVEWLGASFVLVTGVVSFSLLQPPQQRIDCSSTVGLIDNTNQRFTFKHHATYAVSHLPPYDTSVRAIKGNRVTMEDEFVVANGGRFVAVFDGHGGGGVSRYLQLHLWPLVQHYTHEAYQEESKPNGYPSLNSHVAALRQAFTQIDDDILSQDQLQYQGSTAVAVLLHEETQTLLSANVGDSRAILSRNRKAIDLTRDHKPNDEKEKARILALNETIEWDALSKVHRVRNLSLSRAMGDRYAKPVVSSTVEIKHYAITTEDEFCLLASDGLWDVMTSQEVVNFVHQRMEKELAQVHSDDRENVKLVLRRNMAKFVAREAYRRGSGDNICVCMVWLDKKKR